MPLRDLLRRDIPFIVSYDGRTGNKRYGRPLPASLGLTHVEVLAGRSTQATLLGRDAQHVRIAVPLPPGSWSIEQHLVHGPSGNGVDAPLFRGGPLIAKKMSKAAMEALAAVTGKRARIVVEHILKYGFHHDGRSQGEVRVRPPASRHQGCFLTKASRSSRRIVSKKDGKRMAEYRFGDLDNITAGRIGGRTNFPKSVQGSPRRRVRQQMLPLQRPVGGPVSPDRSPHPVPSSLARASRRRWT